MADHHKIRIKIGNAEFEAEGDKESVERQFEAFKEILASPPAPAAKPGGTIDDGEHETGDPDLDLLMAKAFQTDKDGIVSLKAFPPGKQRNADALLLILYGFHQLRGEENVYGTKMTRAATVSGLGVSRVDRAIAPNLEYIIRGGRKRSATYALNNRGKDRAKEILNQMFE